MPAPAWGASQSFLAAGVRGDARWQSTLDADEVLEAGAFHGVLPLVFQASHEDAGWHDWPESLRIGLKDAARFHAALELAHRLETIEMLDALAARGIGTIVLKGAALAHTLYEQPWLRTRGDTDLLVRLADRHAASAVLEQLGYRRREVAGGELASSEASFHRPGSALPFDLHWRINNSSLLSPLLEFDSLRARTAPVTALGPHARCPGLVDAVLLAATHRATHHHMPMRVDGHEHRGDRLIWLYDLHLLVPRLAPAQLGELAERAARHRVAGLCLDALRTAQASFGTALPAALVQSLERDAARDEPSMVFLRGGRRALLLAEVRALAGWSQRWQLLREHAFPPADYMLRKYDTRRSWLLPVLYVRRALGWLSK
jgi:Uncharacterised nucleotidyltransferase